MLRPGIWPLKSYVCVFISHVLRHYLLSAECTVICKDDVVRYMLSMPIMSGRIGKWILALSKFDLRYESAKAVKGQIMANFVTQHYGTVETLKLYLERFSLMDPRVTGGRNWHSINFPSGKEVRVFLADCCHINK